MRLDKQIELLLNNLMEEYSLLSLKYSKYKEIVVITPDSDSWPGVLASYLVGKFSELRLEPIPLSRLLYYFPNYIGHDKLVIFALKNYDGVGLVINSMLKAGIEVVALIPYKDGKIEGVDSKFYSRNFRTIEGVDESEEVVGYEPYVLSSMLNLFLIYLFRERNIPIDFLLKVEVNLFPQTVKQLFDNKKIKQLSKELEFDSLVCDPLRFFLFRNSSFSRLLKIYSYDEAVKENALVVKPRTTYVPKEVYSKYLSIKDKHKQLDPFSFVEVRGTGAKNDILLSPLYLLLLDLLLKYKSSP